MKALVLQEKKKDMTALEVSLFLCFAILRGTTSTEVMVFDFSKQPYFRTPTFGYFGFLFHPNSSLEVLESEKLQVAAENHKECAVGCARNLSCLSFNIGKKPIFFNGGVAQYLCELLPTDKYDSSSIYRSKTPEFDHYSIRSPCSKYPCLHNFTCIPNYNNDNYECQCPRPPFEGKHCKDVDECTTVQHNCSVNATCTNMVGLFNCTCNDGFLGNGRTCTVKTVIGTLENPAKSCLEILNAGDSNGNGEYWIDPANTGSPFLAYCDMTTDGGGWTVVRKLVQPSNSILTSRMVETYNIIKSYDRRDVNIYPTGGAMLDIKNKMGFHQIHFYCRKVNVGRVVSIMTKSNTAGQDVVAYFTAPDGVPRPTACGSFDRLPDDTSILSQNCDQWGDSPENQWGAACCQGKKRIATMAFRIGSSHGFEFSSAFSCDNSAPYYNGLKVPPDVGDVWQISVR